MLMAGSYSLRLVILTCLVIIRDLQENELIQYRTRYCVVTRPVLLNFKLS